MDKSDEKRYEMMMELKGMLQQQWSTWVKHDNEFPPEGDTTAWVNWFGESATIAAALVVTAAKYHDEVVLFIESCKKPEYRRDIQWPADLTEH